MLRLGIPTREDLVASLVVFIIAMPLSLGIALASGASPAAGLLTAVAGGIVAGLLAGAPLGVTGPAAGMSAMRSDTGAMAQSQVEVPMILTKVPIWIPDPTAP